MKDRPPELLSFEEAFRRDPHVEPDDLAVGYSFCAGECVAWHEVGNLIVPTNVFVRSAMRPHLYKWSLGITADLRARVIRSLQQNA